MQILTLKTFNNLKTDSFKGRKDLYRLSDNHIFKPCIRVPHCLFYSLASKYYCQKHLVVLEAGNIYIVEFSLLSGSTRMFLHPLKARWNLIYGPDRLFKINVLVHSTTFTHLHDYWREPIQCKSDLLEDFFFGIFLIICWFNMHPVF